MTPTFYTDHSDDEIVWRAPRAALASSPHNSDFSSDFSILSRSLSPAEPLITSGSQGRTPAGSHSAATINLSLAERVDNLRISGTPRGSAKKQAKEPKRAVLQNAENQPASTEQKKPKKKAKRKAVAAAENVYPSPSPRANNTASTKGKKERRGSKSTKPTAPQGNPTPDDKSDKRPVVATIPEASAPSLYEEASTFISRFLSNPDAKNDSICRLTLLQSLIIELGLATSNLPASLTSARAFLKSRAHLNIREYVDVRSLGPDAIRRAMYPSKLALLKDLKKHKKKRAPRQWVKDMGLQVLLVGWMQ